MSLSWRQRKTRLASLLNNTGRDDEDAEGVAIDRLMHGQSVIGKTAKTVEIDTLRFKDNDLDVVGTLEYGQFGVIDVVTCRLNNCVYVRKSIEKRFALRTRDQCSPQHERDLLLQAVKTNSPWAPHLLCAFQTTTHLNLIMDYAEGGTLWDVLESSPHDGRVLESDLMWWAPQLVSAIHWCHSQGFAHRDIKPHNFVLTTDAHVLLIDFGSAAPLLPPSADGSQLIPKRYCLVPCGTCDYISPEILQAHEEALVALEMEDGELEFNPESEGYGMETDWWSLGAMLYEMAYGVAPFFANDIRQTYVRIMNHERGLRFDQKVPISHEYQHFLRRLLTHAKQRLGRRNVMEITDHPIFRDVNWIFLETQPAPPDLHLPQFTYSDPKASTTAAPAPAPAKSLHEDSNSHSQGFAFSAFFQSSSVSPGLSVLRPSPGVKVDQPSASVSWKDSSSSTSSFIGFSWGPKFDAFPDEISRSASDAPSTAILSTPQPLLRSSALITPMPNRLTSNTLSVPPSWGISTGMFSTPRPLQAFSTPLKPYAMSPYATLPRMSTIRRTAPRRIVSDREAMKQLVECVGMSARKKVLESGRKPKILGIFASRGSAGTATNKPGSGGATTRSSNFGTLRKELRFDRFTTPIPGPDYSAASSARSRAAANITDGKANALEDPSDIYCSEDPYDGEAYTSSESTDSDGGGPPSPSPSPRPGSAMSMMSMTMMSRRSGTPTISGHFGMMNGRARSGSGSALALPPLGDRSVTATTTTTTSTGLLSIPSAGIIGNPGFKIASGPRLSAVNDLQVKVPVFVASDIPQEKPKTAQPKTFSPPAFTSSPFESTPVQASAKATIVPPVASNLQKTTMKRKPSHGRRRSSPPRPSRSDDHDHEYKLRELERRHTMIMQDISDLEGRLDEIVELVRGRR
ncbi:kinase-like protein [Pholiota conissans]|uniref:Kinase-like protein n=1 Tax=Pholiota conissans TaxID=109636 RepID=A0A9P5YNV6_9AGAR|nr:kinase-like protein [Pholiota conissans]